MKRKIVIGLLIVAVGIQFIRIDKDNPSVDPAQDFIAITQPPEAITQTLKIACYDCHSNQSEFPWYTNIAPVSWWVKDHINEAREELNFSEWGGFSAKKADHKLEECVELVEEEEMPLDSYTWMHSEAKLRSEQRQQLEDWFRALRTKAN